MTTTTFGSGPLHFPASITAALAAAIGGPIIPKEILGGKTYFFFNYEGFNFPQSDHHRQERPISACRGLLLIVTGAIDYNLNNAAVTYNGMPVPANYGCALGTERTLRSAWSRTQSLSFNRFGTHTSRRRMPPAAQTLCDGANVLGFAGNIGVPITSKFVAARLDHDFSPKWHFNATYHFYKLTEPTTDQVDIGGFFPGDTKGVPASCPRIRRATDVGRGSDHQHHL